MPYIHNIIDISEKGVSFLLHLGKKTRELQKQEVSGSFGKINPEEKK